MKKIPTVFRRDPEDMAHVNGNPEGFDGHVLVSHENAERHPLLDHPLDRAGVRWSMSLRPWEGIVWHHPDGRMAKLKVRDFPKS